MPSYAELAKSIPSGGNRFFRFSPGDNRIRVLSVAIPVWKPEYVPGNADFRYCLTEQGAHRAGFGPAPAKFACWIIDRADGGVKHAEFGAQIVKALARLSGTDGYQFETVPDYDIIVNQSKVAERTEYNVLPYPMKQPLTPDEERAFKEAGDMAHFLREKAEDKDLVAPF